MYISACMQDAGDRRWSANPGYVHTYPMQANGVSHRAVVYNVYNSESLQGADIIRGDSSMSIVPYSILDAHRSVPHGPSPQGVDNTQNTIPERIASTPRHNRRNSPCDTILHKNPSPQTANVQMLQGAKNIEMAMGIDVVHALDMPTVLQGAVTSPNCTFIIRHHNTKK